MLHPKTRPYSCFSIRCAISYLNDSGLLMRSHLHYYTSIWCKLTVRDPKFGYKQREVLNCFFCTVCCISMKQAKLNSCSTITSTVNI